ncbi:diguanylate cyclase [Deinococcus sp. QL22]|uniref:GGDEF domain-containing protein n=1 Tax=Deinococcus sp. QL22 TaxID=2939437 RepID=UPI00201702C6|nr:GGDEF domain-containing protein [Deinococcus sp. QL22]UQN09293.1 GGDEF domain-containing protein [Deinococcus sp. QL22]
MSVPRFLSRHGRYLKETQRQLYQTVAALSMTVQLVIAGIDAIRPVGQWPLEPLIGAAICGVTAALLRYTQLPWRWMEYGILAAASLSVTGQLALAVPPAPSPRLLFTGVFLFLAGFTVLQARWASLYALSVFTAFGAVTLLRGGDLTLLAELGLSGILSAHLSIYGRQLSAERAEVAVMQRLAHTDALTGLENRRAMTAHLETALAATPGALVTVLLLDIDHFKEVNDRWGHAVGDQVLKVVAERLKVTVGTQGQVARWGGEEFLITLSRLDPVPLRALAEELRQAMVPPAPGVPPVTFSIGVAGRDEVSTLDEWLQLADARLYQAKQTGRNRVEGLPVDPPLEPKA